MSNDTRFLPQKLEVRRSLTYIQREGQIGYWESVDNNHCSILKLTHDTIFNIHSDGSLIFNPNGNQNLEKWVYVGPVNIVLRK